MARSTAVTTAATTTHPITERKRHATKPPAATPTVSAPTARCRPFASACVATSAANSAGASRITTLVNHSGSSRPPSATGPRDCAAGDGGPRGTPPGPPPPAAECHRADGLDDERDDGAGADQRDGAAH